MQVQDGMSKVVLSVGPDHTLREAARQMAERRVGAAVVLDPESDGPGIITERDVLISVGRGESPDEEKVGRHLTSAVVYAAPDWPLEQAAAEMVRGGFRHLIVCDGPDVVGVLSVRDVVRCWTDDGATSEMPEETAAARRRWRHGGRSMRRPPAPCAVLAGVRAVLRAAHRVGHLDRVVVGRQVAVLLAGVADPRDQHRERQEYAGDPEDRAECHAEERDRDADVEEERLGVGPMDVDLLARGRDVAVDGAHQRL